jgi:hypothetical protein
VTLMCHPFDKLRAGSEAEPKDLVNEKEILRFAQNDSFAVTLGTLYFLCFRFLVLVLFILFNIATSVTNVNKSR